MAGVDSGQPPSKIFGRWAAHAKTREGRHNRPSPVQTVVYAAHLVDRDEAMQRLPYSGAIAEIVKIGGLPKLGATVFHGMCMYLV